MPIVTIPHPSLRLTAQPITVVDEKILQVMQDLEQNLLHHQLGVGLAAVQIDRPVRMLGTYLDRQGDTESNRVFRLFLNPELRHTFGQIELGGDDDSTPLEGCLSIPHYYGPVPRYPKIELTYQTWEDNKFVSHSEEFSDFFARVIQHELDHLNGVLFTDYSLEYDLPLYKESAKSGKLEEINRSERAIFEMI
jgi:peptide deformylase